MKILGLSIFAFVFPTFGVAEPQAYLENEVKLLSEREWPNDFTMIAHCLNQKKRGYQNFVQLYHDTILPGLTKSFEICQVEWGAQWDMVSFCAEQQIKGHSKIPLIIVGIPAEVSSKILDKCSADWSVDFSMVAYCVEQQSSAWRSLNN